MQSYEYEGYTLTLHATGHRGEYNKAQVEYHLTDPDGATIFHGSDLYASPLHDPEGNENAAACLSLLTWEADTLASGNYPPEHEYNDRQRDFLVNQWERLSIWPIELEEGVLTHD